MEKYKITWAEKYPQTKLEILSCTLGSSTKQQNQFNETIEAFLN